MNYIIKKGSSSSFYIFILTGAFLVISFSFNLYHHLQQYHFISKFPGDWDKPLGIIIGIFLLIRSQKFSNQRKGLFIKTHNNQLIYRLKSSDSVQKINLNKVRTVKTHGDSIFIETAIETKNIDLSSVSSNQSKKEIRKALLRLNP